MSKNRPEAVLLFIKVIMEILGLNKRTLYYPLPHTSRRTRHTSIQKVAYSKVNKQCLRRMKYAMIEKYC